MDDNEASDGVVPFNDGYLAMRAEVHWWSGLG